MNNDVYWVGQNGNIYLKTTGGVRDMGKLLPGGQVLKDGVSGTQQGSFEAGGGRINDPALANRQTAEAPGGIGSGGGTSYEPLNQAAVNATNQSLNSLSTVLANALSSARTGYDNAQRLMSQQEAQQRKAYDEGTLSNQQNYDSNLGASIRAGSRGLSGLLSALSGGGGSGNQFARNWVGDVVSNTTSNDIREGYSDFDSNRQELDNVQSTFMTDLGRRRSENRDTLENNRRAARLYDAQQRQSLLEKLANLYGDAGDTAQRDTYISRAGGQAPNIAKNMGAKVSSYNKAPIDVASPDITAFSAPEEQTIQASPTNQETGIFSILDPRRRRDTAGV